MDTENKYIPVGVIICEECGVGITALGVVDSPEEAERLIEECQAQEEASNDDGHQLYYGVLEPPLTMPSFGDRVFLSFTQPSMQRRVLDFFKNVPPNTDGGDQSN